MLAIQSNKIQSQGQRKAVAYIRVSTPKQEKEGFSPEAQEELIREYVEEKSLKLVRVFRAAEAGGPDKEKRRFNEMIDCIVDNNVSTLLSEKPDRLYRNYGDAHLLDTMRKDRGLIIY